ncbi:MAG: hypothetical protein AAF467_10505 [Actinomycetota bacterium]
MLLDGKSLLLGAGRHGWTGAFQLCLAVLCVLLIASGCTSGGEDGGSDQRVTTPELTEIGPLTTVVDGVVVDAVALQADESSTRFLFRVTNTLDDAEWFDFRHPNATRQPQVIWEASTGLFLTDRSTGETRGPIILDGDPMTCLCTYRERLDPGQSVVGFAEYLPVEPGAAVDIVIPGAGVIRFEDGVPVLR